MVHIFDKNNIGLYHDDGLMQMEVEATKDGWNVPEIKNYKNIQRSRFEVGDHEESEPSWISWYNALSNKRNTLNYWKARKNVPLHMNKNTPPKKKYRWIY